jgi:hypothetical protein
VVAERPFFEECDLTGGAAACVLLVRVVQDLTDGVLLLIMLRCYSYFNNVEIYMNNDLYKFY